MAGNEGSSSEIAKQCVAAEKLDFESLRLSLGAIGGVF
jgi:hypothetical protein